MPNFLGYNTLLQLLPEFPVLGDRHASPVFFRGLQALCKKVCINMSIAVYKYYIY